MPTKKRKAPMDPKSTKPKRAAAAKGWCFTWHAPYNVDALVEKFTTMDLSYIFAEEVGGEGETPHLQGYILSEFKIRPMEKLKLDPKIHWESARGTKDENRRYCSKEGGNMFYSPDCKPIRPLKLITEFKPWQRGVVDLVSKPCDEDRLIHWYYDEAGSIGKTVLCKYLSAKHGAVLVQGARRHILATAFAHETDIYIVAVPRAPDPLEGEKRRPGPAVSYDALESLKDGYYHSGFGTEATGMVVRNSPHVLVFANDPPDTSRLTANRWKITNLGAHTLGFGHL